MPRVITIALSVAMTGCGTSNRFTEEHISALRRVEPIMEAGDMLLPAPVDWDVNPSPEDMALIERLRTLDHESSSDGKRVIEAFDSIYN